MKYITDYLEFGGDVNKSVLNFCSTENIVGKDTIIKYLKGGKDDGIRCSVVYDYIKKERKNETTRLFTDGEFYWDSEEIYHFEKYNIILNEDFVRKVLSSVN